MGLKIKLHQNTIPIEFEDPETGEIVETLHFDKTDDAIQKLRKQDEVIKELAEELDEKNAELEETKKLVKTCFDAVFGENAFEKIYKINPSCLILLQYYISAVVYIRKEMDDFEGAKDLEKYITG
jgi:hypothetical protein